MAKGRPKSEPGQSSTVEDRVVLYLEVPRQLKLLMGKAAKLHNRKLTGECIQAMQDYLVSHRLLSPPELPAN